MEGLLGELVGLCILAQKDEFSELPNSPSAFRGLDKPINFAVSFQLDCHSGHFSYNTFTC